jgi:hypothetical protein
MAIPSGDGYTGTGGRDTIERRSATSQPSELMVVHQHDGAARAGQISAQNLNSKSSDCASSMIVAASSSMTFSSKFVRARFSASPASMGTGRQLFEALAARAAPAGT